MSRYADHPSPETLYLWNTHLTKTPTARPSTNYPEHDSTESPQNTGTKNSHLTLRGLGNKKLTDKFVRGIVHVLFRLIPVLFVDLVLLALREIQSYFRW